MSDPKKGIGTQAELNELHGLIARELAAKIRDKTATAADISAAIKFLANNGIQAVVTPENPLGALAAAVTDDLPFAGTDGPTH
jgi:hypothetical protein